MSRSRKVRRHTLGSRIRALRLDRGWTQKDLARALGRSLSQVKKYESGMHVPPAEKLLHLASLLGVSLEELLPATLRRTRVISAGCP